MLAKVIAWAPTRAEAAARLAAALAGATLHGVTTNRDLLVRTLRHEDFLAGRIDTAFFDRIGLDRLAAPLAGPDEQALAVLAGALAGAAARRRAAAVLGELPSGWRNVPSQPQRAAFELVGSDRRGRLPAHPGRARRGGPRRRRPRVGDGGRGRADRRRGRAPLPDFRRRKSREIDVDGDGWSVALRVLPRFPDAVAAVAEGSLIAPMPGAVVAVHVAAGDAVAAGQLLLVLEAMKMQHPVLAPTAGTVRSLDVGVGTQVDAGAVLTVIEPTEEP